MTREEAIRYLSVYSSTRGSGQCTDKQHYEAKQIAIEALEQELCSDAISRQATAERLCKLADFMNEKRKGSGSPYVMAALFIQSNKDEFPPVTPQLKMGHWGKDGECPFCGYLRQWNDDNFCSHCGAKMQEVIEE